jgi:hypothetical protein
MPIEIDGSELDELPVSSEEIDEVRVNGTLVYRSETPIDVFDRGSLDYWIGDAGQSDLPHIAGGAGFDNDNALRLPPNAPNQTANLSPNNPSHSSSDQDIDLDNYLEPGDIAEVYFRAVDFGLPSQFRWALFTDDYYGDHDSIRLRFTDDYFRLEQGSSLYGGTGDSESSTGFDPGDWHRVVIDTSDFPEIYCHLWNADTGDWIDTVGGTGDGNPDTPGHYAWWNSDTEMFVSDYRLIDENDFSVGSDL